MASSDLRRKLSIEDVDFSNKRVLIRVDFNVPLKKKPVTGETKISDTGRIKAAIPTLNYILSKNARSLVIMSHLGRPEGRRDPKQSLSQIIPDLQALLGRPVIFLDSCVGPATEARCAAPPQGSVFLLENVRFEIAETGKGLDAQGKKHKASPEAVQAFRASLTKLGDIFVNDAFGAAHRAHSSVVGIGLPTRVAGFLMGQELRSFGSVLHEPARPFLAVLGGAKVKDKLPIIMNLLDKVDEMIISGAMAYTFLKATENMEIGASLFDESGFKLVPSIVAKAKAKGVKLHLPVDFRCADKFAYDAKVEDANRETGIKAGWMALDVGPQTRVNDAEVIWRAKSIILNGPIGVFEFHTFAAGTICAMQAIAAATKLNGAVSIIGGGDTASAVRRMKMEKLMTHVSTGGGAALELLEGRSLPGIENLSSRAQL